MFDVAVALCDPERFGDADDPLAAYLYGPKPDLWQLRETDPLLAPWIERATTLVNIGPMSVSVSDSAESEQAGTRTVARMESGPHIDHDQATIEDVIL